MTVDTRTGEILTTDRAAADHDYPPTPSRINGEAS